MGDLEKPKNEVKINHKFMPYVVRYAGTKTKTLCAVKLSTKNTYRVIHILSGLTIQHFSSYKDCKKFMTCMKKCSEGKELMEWLTWDKFKAGRADRIPIYIKQCCAGLDVVTNEQRILGTFNYKLV